MATKKKELLEQENSAPETTVPVENTPPTDETQADMAAPSDGGDLNELLASMDQTDEDAAPMAAGGALPELTESAVFGTVAADTAAADALPGEDDTAVLAEGPDSDDGEDTSAVPADEMCIRDSVRAVWVLLDFIRRVDYHAPADFPVKLVFFADGELYEIAYIAAGQEALVCHALRGNKEIGRAHV